MVFGVLFDCLRLCDSALTVGERISRRAVALQELDALYSAECNKQKAEVMELGGLHVIGTERHESRRIDNQLRGRTGRQGDPGSTRFFLSLEDNIFRIFGGDKIQGLMSVRLCLPLGSPLQPSRSWQPKAVQSSARAAWSLGAFSCS